MIYPIGYSNFIDAFRKAMKVKRNENDVYLIFKDMLPFPNRQYKISVNEIFDWYHRTGSYYKDITHYLMDSSLRNVVGAGRWTSVEGDVIEWHGFGGTTLHGRLNNIIRDYASNVNLIVCGEWYIEFEQNSQNTKDKRRRSCRQTIKIYKEMELEL